MKKRVIKEVWMPSRPHRRSTDKELITVQRRRRI
jgi:hypothetical protein